ncbi:PAS domain S-box protein [Mycolicibacterium celeriflavum]|uniref:histidine kinase n=2 Tax=Mycolicibacterium celeriflavum TaxID=1249101 RepID=A0A1X0BYD8_MYCCF|nr:PAS domain S-box protein [Mycolicibacterium celeriflavum]ORA49557.1 PAS sensor domain-containing protein [Mycolicibacterium celeriflavum]BBY43962.1 signal transduction histidine kinase [Mycolicibacterium celeriflavum]
MDDALIAAAILTGPDAIICADRDGVITFWNASAQRVFGYTPAEAAGQSLDLIIPERLRARHWKGWQTVMATGQSRYGDGDLLSVPAVRKDGSTISVEFTIAPLFGVDDEMFGMAATLRDVTARFEETRELRRQLAART